MALEVHEVRRAVADDDMPILGGLTTMDGTEVFGAAMSGAPESF